MPKCPKCGNDLQLVENGTYYCSVCNKTYKTKSQPQYQPVCETPPVVASTHNAESAKDKEIELLKARLDALERGNSAPKQSKTKVAIQSSKAVLFIKKYGVIIFPVLLLLIAFITLMTCLVGIRGIYVNVNDPNEFYSFTATSYEYHGKSMFGGGDYVDKGTWKKSGNTLSLTYDDEDFGKISENCVIIKNENNKLLVLEDELGMQKTFKRVNLVNYSSVVTKVKVTFDANGGLVNNSDKNTVKVKIGNKVQAPTPSRQDCQFMGWYTEPYGYKSGTAQMQDQRTSIWENVTYYANWYNPNNYVITFTGEADGTLTAKEGDNLLNLLHSQYEDCEFMFNNKTIDSTFTMPAYNIEVNCSYSEEYWQKLEQIFVFNEYRNGTEHWFGISGKDANISGDIVIPSNYRGNKITQIDDFSDCTNITSIIIPDSVTSISLNGCSGLTSITVDENNQHYASQDRILYNKSKTNIIHVPKSIQGAVIIPDSVTSIGDYAFRGCSGLTSITLPDSVTSIGDYAFRGCSGLTSVTIGNGVTSIGWGAFSNCSGLTSITLPDSVTSIGEWAFSNCSGLTSITLPDSVTSIGEWAFSDCTGLTSVTIGNSVTSIGSYAFNGCSELKAVYITDMAKWCGISFGAYGANPLLYARNLYLNGELVRDLVIPDSVTTIAGYTFYNCTGLTSITIPDSVTSIDYEAFRNCNCLVEVFNKSSLNITAGSGDYGYVGLYAENVYTPTSGESKLTVDAGVIIYDGETVVGYTGDVSAVIIPNYVTTIAGYAFDNCSGLTSITIPDSVTSIGEGAFYRCSGLTSVTIPDSVTSIGSEMFYGCTGLTSVTIGNGMTSTGFGAFSGCTGLTSITIPNSVTSISNYAFSGCSGLTSITIPDSVTSISNYAFSGCSGLTSITIPDSVTSIGANAFSGCSGLKSVTIGNGVTSIGYEAFSGCSGLTSITIPDSVTSIGGYAFYECIELTTIIIPDSVTSIGRYAFYNCTGLTSVTIPDSVTSIDSYAFYRCSGLTSIVVEQGNTKYHSAGNCIIETESKILILGCKTSIIPTDGSVTSIDYSAFSGCSGLTSITIPDSVTSIGDGAFSGCSGLTSVTIGNGVTSIGNYAFRDCVGLTSITIPDSVTSIGYGAFRDCVGLTSITIPDSVTSIGSYAFDGCSELTSVTFTGTKAQWLTIKKGNGWKDNTPDLIIHCTDGDLDKYGNEI